MDAEKQQPKVAEVEQPIFVRRVLPKQFKEGIKFRRRLKVLKRRQVQAAKRAAGGRRLNEHELLLASGSVSREELYSFKERA